MKKIKWSSIVIAICYIVAGSLFLYDTNITKEIICTWIGYGLLACGLVYIVSYFIRPKHESFLKNDFRDGMILLTLGILPLVKKNMFLELVYFIIAVVIMISGYKKLQDCVDAWRLGAKHGVLYFVLASISIVIGLVIMLDTTINTRPLHYLIAGGLLFSGISDLISTIFLASKMSKYIRRINKEKAEQEETVEEQTEALETQLEQEPVQVDEEILDDENKNPEV